MTLVLFFRNRLSQSSILLFTICIRKTAIFLHCKKALLLIFLLLLSIVDYAALLSQKSSLASSMPSTTASATGRLYFRKKTLTYSFVSSPDFGKAKLLTFLDTDGNIVEEFPLGVCIIYYYFCTAGK